jgi:hypothetical protein
MAGTARHGTARHGTRLAQRPWHLHRQAAALEEDVHST